MLTSNYMITNRKKNLSNYDYVYEVTGARLMKRKHASRRPSASSLMKTTNFYLNTNLYIYLKMEKKSPRVKQISRIPSLVNCDVHLWKLSTGAIIIISISGHIENNHWTLIVVPVPLINTTRGQSREKDSTRQKAPLLVCKGRKYYRYLFLFRINKMSSVKTAKILPRILLLFYRLPASQYVFS